MLLGIGPADAQQNPEQIATPPLSLSPSPLLPYKPPSPSSPPLPPGFPPSPPTPPSPPGSPPAPPTPPLPPATPPAAPHRPRRLPHTFNATVMSELRTDILSPLDPYVPPSNLDGNGTRVSTQFRLFKVLNVDIASGKLWLKIWRRTVWYDDRLEWDPADYDGIQEFLAYPLNRREYEMDNKLWLPSMYTTNSITSEADSTEVGGAWVRHDGRVWHSVPGTLELSCRFNNLVNFPQDVPL